MRISLISLAAVFLGASIATSAAGLRPLRGEAVSVRLGCKLAGIRFVGAGPGKAPVCFTLTANRKTIREYAYDVCAAAKSAVSSSRSAKPVAVHANGTFSATTIALAAGEAGIGFVDVIFSGRIQGNTASGSLALRAHDPGGGTFRCKWTARRAAG